MVLPAVLRDPARDAGQAGRRADDVRLDRGAVRAALARHQPGALHALPPAVVALPVLAGRRSSCCSTAAAAAGGPYVTHQPLATAYYFLFFLVILPLLGKLERPLPLPESITEPVLRGGGPVHGRRHEQADGEG